MRRLLITVILLLPLAAHAQKAQQLAPTPPMGWNSWDAYGLTITEAQFRDNVSVMATALKSSGYNYAVIDEGWFMRNPLDRNTPDKLTYEFDSNGRYLPVPARFPSSLESGTNTGFRALAASVHAQGLKFGIHIVRGIPRESVTRNTPIAASRFHAQDAADTSDACPWDPTNWGIRDTPAGQAWYDSLLQQYAAWGVDYLKVDCISDHPYKPAEIRMLHRAILKTGRPIVLSLSPGPTSPGIAAELAPYAQLWRISDDIHDLWKNSRPFPRSVYGQFELLAGWAPYARPGSWPDADMLPFGYLGPYPGDGTARQSRLNPAEQQTMLTLWSIARSPLILGANLTRLDADTTTLLTNKEVLAVDQTAHDQRQVAVEGDTIAWTAAGPGNIKYLALFNRADTPTTIDHTFAFYNLPATPYTLHDLWLHTDAPATTQLKLTLPPHASTLLKLTP